MRKESSLFWLYRQNNIAYNLFSLEYTHVWVSTVPPMLDTQSYTADNIPAASILPAKVY